MTLTNRFNDFIKSKNLFQKDDLLILAVSGGMDSVTLCELCFQSGYEFEIAHCNFQLRGDESTRDEKFVEQMAAKYQVPFHVRSFDTAAYADQHKLSTQEAARNLRYEWFQWLLQHKKDQKINAYLLTAHHANDSIETLLMNFFKGTGIHGLKGIPLKNKNIVRPLIFVTRNEITAFVKDHNLSYVEDTSNLSDKYTRNYFRNRLIPALQEIYPTVEENLLNNLTRFEDAALLFDKAIHDIRKKLVEEKGKELHMPVLKILKTTAYKTVLYEILKDFHFLPSQMPDIIQLLYTDSGKYVDSSTHRCLRNRKWLIVAPKNTAVANTILIEEEDNTVRFPQGVLKIEKKKWQSGMKISKDEKVALVDASGVAFPLLLRPWKQGDYFYPLGMQHKKKLSRFFIDQKLSMPDKEKIWVLESRKKILWVVGLRIDDRFRITDSTQHILQIQWQADQ